MNPQENVKTSVNKRSSFDLSFDGVLSQDWGDLVPIVCKEMVPGDTFNCSSQVFTRLAPLASPTYGRIHGYINYFFVPNRILLANDLWEDFIRGGVDGTRTYTLPYFTPNDARGVSSSSTSWTSSDVRDVRKLFTYFNLPDSLQFASGNNSFHLSVLPFAAYNRIYGDYYFPWGVEDDADVEALYFKKLTGSRINAIFPEIVARGKFFQLKHACFKKDYLTTAQTRPQRGNSVYAPTSDSPSGDIYEPDNVPSFSSDGNGVSTLALRWANSIQRFLERNNIAGARYFEQILARFGVSFPAERLQRSEYLGGSDFWINISDVTSTADTKTTESGASLGSLAGKGIGLGDCGVSYTSKDYGFFFAIVHLMPESGSPQGLDRMWFRSERLDYFTPEMEDTGNQPIYNGEVFAEPWISSNNPNIYTTGVFGYIPRYAEYKFSRPLLGGDFRLSLYDENFSPTLKNDMASMHLYRLFGRISTTAWDTPTLNSDWLVLDSPKVGMFNRIFQDTNTDFDHFWTNIQVQLTALRPMIGYLEASTPFQIDEHHASVSLPAFGMRL